MKKTKWWLIVVGVFYLLLTCMNLYALFFDNSIIRGTLPPPVNDDTLKAFSDAWMVFNFEFGVLGGMCVNASHTPTQSRLLMLTVIFAEVFRGIAADAIWMTRGYSTADYIPFIIIHLIIIVTGVMWLPKKAP